MKSKLFAAAIAITAFVAIPSASAQGFDGMSGTPASMVSDAAGDWWSGAEPIARTAEVARMSRPTSSAGYAPSFARNPIASANQMMSMGSSSFESASQFAGDFQNGVNAISSMVEAEASSHVLDKAVDFAHALSLTRLKPKSAYSMKVPPIDRGW